jgi:hypothetical protein
MTDESSDPNCFGFIDRRIERPVMASNIPPEARLRSTDAESPFRFLPLSRNPVPRASAGKS